jgi:hypothetical protein
MTTRVSPKLLSLRPFADLHPLYRDPENELVATNGTHPLLDVFRLFPAGTPDDYGTLVRLTAEQVTGAVCTEKPSWAQFEIAYADNSVENRLDANIRRCSVRCTPFSGGVCGGLTAAPWAKESTRSPGAGRVQGR